MALIKVQVCISVYLIYVLVKECTSDVVYWYGLQDFNQDVIIIDNSLKINHDVQNGCRMWYSNNSQIFRNKWDRDNFMMDEDVSVMLRALFIYLSIYLSTIFTAEENSNHYISKTENKYLTHLCPMPPFSIAWKH